MHSSLKREKIPSNLAMMGLGARGGKKSGGGGGGDQRDTFNIGGAGATKACATWGGGGGGPTHRLYCDWGQSEVGQEVLQKVYLGMVKWPTN